MAKIRRHAYRKGLWTTGSLRKGNSGISCRYLQSACQRPLGGIFRNGGVIPTDEITPKYSHYLCFTVSVRTNRLVHHRDRWTAQQEETIQLVKQLQKSGLGYRKIAKYLNAKSIKTSKGNSWKNTTVFSFLKRYKERQERLSFIEKEYEPVWGKMRVIWEINY